MIRNLLEQPIRLRPCPKEIWYLPFEEELDLVRRSLGDDGLHEIRTKC